MLVWILRHDVDTGRWVDYRLNGRGIVGGGGGGWSRVSTPGGQNKLCLYLVWRFLALRLCSNVVVCVLTSRPYIPLFLFSGSWLSVPPFERSPGGTVEYPHQVSQPYRTISCGVKMRIGEGVIQISAQLHKQR